MNRALRCATAVVASVALTLSACGGGGGGGGSSAPAAPAAATGVYSQPAAASLAASDVQQVIAQSVAEAQARGTPAVIAVSDRVGNVLAVYKMVGAPTSLVVRGATSSKDVLPGLSLPSALPAGSAAPSTYVALAAIAKAITGAYLSSSGNAFSTRTASEIVQDTFPPQPATVGLGSGPLFGVQFSSLPCSDLELPALASGASIGPKPSPLGLAADPGGFPLYKNGVLVGGVGVKADSDYGYDPNVTQANAQQAGEEAIALAGTVGFDPPSGITADQVSVGGNSLIYSDVTTADLKSNPALAPAFGTLTASVGSLFPVPLFFSPGASVLPGQVYGAEGSGVRKSTTAEFNNPDAYILTDGSGNDRFPPSAGSDSPAGSTPLTQAEVASLLQNAFSTMSEARAQIRNPLNSRAEVTISVVDTNGKILGVVRAPDAPIFGIDVSIQKARTASFFSSSYAASDLTGNTTPAFLNYTPQTDIADFVSAFRSFLGDSTQLTGQTAFSARAIAGLSRPLFPDGQVGGPAGPLSRPNGLWSIFSTGLQTALVNQNLATALLVINGNLPVSSAKYCFAPPSSSGGTNRLPNGIQIFAGGEPIYRNGVLVGAIGVSGDGTSQDDMIGFLGIDSAGTALGTISNAPAAIRADQLVINQGGGANRVLYVQCPVSPFLNSTVQNPCAGK